jgi:hypothetical protein
MGPASENEDDGYWHPMGLDRLQGRKAITSSYSGKMLLAGNVDTVNADAPAEQLSK